ncbi:hypothetical protein EF888_07375 [Silicimonas algicola]|uniref:Uncharacterized protein n=1 Tax=Silicimonas algicola TaxID=1826607 RepID=A0A316G3Q8_9RHOB|nr:hypothetical protein [Silicimonas algicola]AZQ66970.1 hypothetical protein EF888_07375 [Silicimonas algicola]PWK55519.1 hypothetical protein C8D95_107185 [Silicimonas algicola]
MAGPSVLYPHPREFERFLYATVGKDRNGTVVTVFSMLARIGLDPWNETAELVALGRDAAGTRLGLLLSRFQDVPALGNAHGQVGRELSLLLPESSRLRSFVPSGSTASQSRGLSGGTILTVLALVLVLIQILVAVLHGSGG